ncbi:hypothetical protein ABG067_004787 [Albugo candida]
MEYRESLQLMRDKSWIMKSQEFVSTRKFKSLLQYDTTFKRISNWASMNSALLSPISEEVSGQESIDSSSEWRDTSMLRASFVSYGSCDSHTQSTHSLSSSHTF